MKQLEFLHIISAILILTVAAGFSFIVKSELEKLAQVFLFSIIIIIISVLAKKIISYSLDADVEHEIWQMQNFGLTKNFQTKKPIPIGAIFPLLLSVLSWGIIKFSAILTYEARALKYRASKRFGPFSYTEMTDRHNAIIGASSTVALLILSIITYLLPGTNLEYLAKLSIYYVFWNLLPISKLDGIQVLMGSRILWSVLFTITIIFLFFALTII